MSKFTFSKEQFEQLKTFVDNILSENEHYDFMFYLVSDLRLSIEEIVEIYDGSTFDDIKCILVEKFNVKFKYCNNCKKTRSTSSFSIKSKTEMPLRLSSFCKMCKAKKMKQILDNDPIARQEANKISTIYQTVNKEKIQEHHKNYFQEHREERKNYDEQNPDKRKKHVKTYHDKHRVQINKQRGEYKRNRRMVDVKFRICSSFPVRIYNSIRDLKGGRHWEDIVGYTINKLMDHLESKFDDKMNWENYGIYWHIDHIVPVAAFTFMSIEDDSFKNCWSLINLQPLKIEDNLKKSDIISEEWNNVELAAQLL